MILISLDVDVEQHSVIAVVIEKDNFARMQEGDPVTIESRIRGGMLAPARYPLNTSLLIAYLEDTKEFYAIAAKRDPVLLIEYLESKRQFKPEVDGAEHVTRLTDWGKDQA
jgi:hypothetical protein